MALRIGCRQKCDLLRKLSGRLPKPEWGIYPDLLKSGGAKGNRTPDLLDANETRYQLRYSP